MRTSLGSDGYDFPAFLEQALERFPKGAVIVEKNDAFTRRGGAEYLTSLLGTRTATLHQYCTAVFPVERATNMLPR